jgi:hypothetical protein
MGEGKYSLYLLLEFRKSTAFRFPFSIGEIKNRGDDSSGCAFLLSEAQCLVVMAVSPLMFGRQKKPS